jgi:hypothetical protein
MSARTRFLEGGRSESGGWYDEIQGNKNALERELKMLYERLHPFDGKRL